MIRNNFNTNFADEIARQLVDCDSKVLFGHASMHKQLEEAVSISKKNIKLVYLKDSQEELIPSMGINFNDLVNTSGKLLDFFQNKGRTCLL